MTHIWCGNPEVASSSLAEGIILLLFVFSFFFVEHKPLIIIFLTNVKNHINQIN